MQSLKGKIKSFRAVKGSYNESTTVFQVTLSKKKNRNIQ